MLSAQKVSFSCNATGDLRIDLDDAVFVRADLIFIDPASRTVSGLIGEIHFSLGQVSPEMAASFMSQGRVILSAPHPQGHELMLMAPVLTLH